MRQMIRLSSLPTEALDCLEKTSTVGKFMETCWKSTFAINREARELETERSVSVSMINIFHNVACSLRMAVAAVNLGQMLVINVHVSFKRS